MLRANTTSVPRSKTIMVRRMAQEMYSFLVQNDSTMTIRATRRIMPTQFAPSPIGICH
jgi:hypothetical protein